MAHVTTGGDTTQYIPLRRLQQWEKTGHVPPRRLWRAVEKELGFTQADLEWWSAHGTPPAPTSAAAMQREMKAEQAEAKREGIPVLSSSSKKQVKKIAQQVKAAHPTGTGAVLGQIFGDIGNALGASNIIGLVVLVVIILLVVKKK